MKAGCFREVGEAFGIQQLSVNSHLFIAHQDVPDFPTEGGPEGYHPCQYSRSQLPSDSRNATQETEVKRRR